MSRRELDPRTLRAAVRRLQRRAKTLRDQDRPTSTIYWVASAEACEYLAKLWAAEARAIERKQKPKGKRKT